MRKPGGQTRRRPDLGPPASGTGEINVCCLSCPVCAICYSSRYRLIHPLRTWPKHLEKWRMHPSLTTIPAGCEEKKGRPAYAMSQVHSNAVCDSPELVTTQVAAHGSTDVQPRSETGAGATHTTRTSRTDVRGETGHNTTHAW